MSTPADRILALFDSLMRVDSMESAVKGAAHRINETVGAVTTGIVVLIPGGVFLEAWYPEDASRPRDVFQSLRNIAIQACFGFCAEATETSNATTNKMAKLRTRIVRLPSFISSTL